MRRIPTPKRLDFGPYGLKATPTRSKEHFDVTLFWKGRPCGPLDIPALASYAVYWILPAFGDDTEAESLSKVILDELTAQLAAMAEQRGSEDAS